MSQSSSAQPPEQMDWEEARRFLRQKLAMKAGSDERSDLDDLAQEACVRLLRTLRREPAEDLKALMSTIANRTWIDFLRRKRRNVDSLDEKEIVLVDTDSDPLLRDPREDLEFVLVEIFERHGAADCKQLALTYLGSLDWKRVAEALELSHAAVRKRWSRCLKVPRRVLAEDPELAWLAS